LNKCNAGQESGDFSYAVQEAFRKRRKAIKRGSGAEVTWTPVKEIIDGRESEYGRTDIYINDKVNGLRVQLTIQVWSDRWVWINARCPTKNGLLWEFTGEGRFVSKNGALGLVECAEKTLSATYLPAPDVSSAISAIWSGYLASGPYPHN
jgi:hypothetical protein